MDNLTKELKKGRILFDYGKSILRSDAFYKLDVMVAILQKNPDMQIELGGHSDSLGNAKGNMKQSIERAQSARGYLLAKGIDDSRIIVKGYGDKKPVATNKTDAGRQLNRRVEIVIEQE
jgi:outer membrane protein OmpA-like peptidoglycan-associated protein